MPVRLGVVAAAAVAHLRCGDPAYALHVVRAVHEEAASLGSVLSVMNVTGAVPDVSVPGAALPGPCSECGVEPGALHRATCFFATGDPADLRENRERAWPDPGELGLDDPRTWPEL